jgi:glutathione S-transferase
MSVKVVQYPGLTRKTTLSGPCAKVRMGLSLKGVEYELVNVSSPMEAKRYNPRGRVPALILGDEVLVDSTDILTELDVRFEGPRLTPESAAERAQAKILEDWADEVLYFYAVYFRWICPEGFGRMKDLVLAKLPIPMRWLAPGIARRETRKRVDGQGVGVKPREVVLRETAECLDALATMLERREWLVGNAYSRADLAVGALVDQMNMPELTPEMARLVTERPVLVGWLARLLEVTPSVARPG